MNLRPVAFFCESSTKLRLHFNYYVGQISISNFSVSTISGSGTDLSIISVDVKDYEVTVTTSLQVPSNYYLLKIISDEENPFLSQEGYELINDDSSREIFFVGIQNKNKIRDSILNNIPSMYSKENSVLSNIIDATSESLLQAQHKIGSVLNDNYLSISVTDEKKTRGTGLYDRLSNENCFKINSVSKYKSDESLYAEKVVSNYGSAKISLVSQDISETILFDSNGEYFSKWIVSASKKNITKVTDLKVIGKDEQSNYFGEIGTIYDIKNLKYSIKDASFDPYNAINYDSLNSNEVLISFFGPQFSVGDSIDISYSYNDASIKIIEETLSIHIVKNIINESIPVISTRFNLKYIPEIDTVTFKMYENSDVTPECFSKEIKFDPSRLPSNSGEYAINYNTGEVWVYGEDGKGTSSQSIYADYTANIYLEKNKDFSYDNQSITLKESSIGWGKDIHVSYEYVSSLPEGIEWVASSHKEEANEIVGANLNSSYSIKTKNSPVTNVFAITNVTTGESYKPIYYNDDSIFFSGNNLPKIKSTLLEGNNFETIWNEPLFPSRDFISSIWEGKILNNIDKENIYIYKNFPFDLINETQSYYLVYGENTSLITEVTLSGDNISKVAISESSELPTKGESAKFGVRILEFKLKNKYILDSSKTKIGSFLSSSVSFDSDLFEQEVLFSSDLKNLNSIGQYSIDYNSGVVFLCVPYDQTIRPGNISYSHADHIPTYSNVLSIDEITSCFENKSFEIINDKIRVKDLCSVTELWDGEIKIQNEKEFIPYIIKDDYTVYFSYSIDNITCLNKLSDFTGDNLYAKYSSERTLQKSYSYLIENSIYNNKMVYTDNILDLKIYNRAFVVWSGSLCEIKFYDQNFSQIYSVIDYNSGDIIIDSEYYDVITDVYFTHSSDSTYIYIDTDLTSLLYEYGYDFIKTDSSQFHKIISFSGGLITIEKTSIDGEDFSSEKIDVVSKYVVQANGEEITLSFSKNEKTKNLKKIEISYLLNNIPQPGTKLAATYSSGPVYFNYSYIQDNITVSYEWGDNSISFIGNEIQDGQTYYASYNYGALREALHQNFANLTGINELMTYPLELDREILRSFLISMFQMYSKGATFDGFSEFVKNITKNSPEIIESFFGNWILGRDTLSNNQPEVVSFHASNQNGKDFCYFNKGIIEPSTLTSSDEGTMHFNFIAEWNGINNDAELTFSLDTVGKRSLSINANNFSKSSFYIDSDIDDYSAGISKSGTINIFKNYKADGSTNQREGFFGIRDDLQLYPTDLSFSIDFKIDYFEGKVEIDNYYKLFEISIKNQHRNLSPSFGFYSNKEISFSTEILHDSLPDYKTPSTVSCKCTYLEYVNVTEMATVISFDSIPSEDIFPMFSSSSKIRNYMILDQDGYLYDIIWCKSNSKTYSASIPLSLEEIKIKRIPFNGREFTSFTSFPQISSFKIIAKVCKVMKTSDEEDYNQNSFDFFGNAEMFLCDLTSFYKFKMSCDISTNIVSINNGEFEYFYSDFEKNSDSNLSVNIYDYCSAAIRNITLSNHFPFQLENVYVGSSAFTPKSKSFKLNRFNNDWSGISSLISERKGIFIGWDQEWDSIDENKGQWRVLTRFDNETTAPSFVSLTGDTYVTTQEFVSYTFNLKGNIISNGEFYSVSTDIEDDDIFNLSSNTISFEIINNSSDDDYYSDGYAISSDVDSFSFSSDLIRYFVKGDKISLYKDGTGFLIFKVGDTIVSKNISDWQKGNPYNVACSWITNSGRDEAHLFIDGQEVPNLYRFGGKVPILADTKISDIEKEYLIDNVTFSDSYSATLSSGKVSPIGIVDSSFIGRGIIIDEGDLSGNYYSIISVESDGFIIGDKDSFQIVSIAGDESITYHFPPFVENIKSDLTSSFSILKEGTRYGGTEVTGLEIVSTVSKPKYRWDKDLKWVEFACQNETSGLWEDFVSIEDTIWIETYGVSSQRINFAYPLSSSKSNEFPVFIKPKSLKDTKIRRNFISEDLISSDDIVDGAFSYSNDNIGLTILETITDTKTNDGRYIEIIISSDNILFGLDDFGNSDCFVDIIGLNSGSEGSERIYITEAGSYFSENRFSNISSVSFSGFVIDDTEDVALISVNEKNDIFTQDGNGSYAIVDKYSNGKIIFSGSDCTFELPDGNYIVDYPAYLHIKYDKNNKNILLFGDEKYSCGGYISDFVIRSEMYSETKPYESDSGATSITKVFESSLPIDMSSNVLFYLNNVDIDREIRRRIRNLSLPSSDGRTLYLSPSEIETLYSLVSNKELFIEKIKMFGFNESEAESIWIKLSCFDMSTQSLLVENKDFNHFISNDIPNDNFDLSIRSISPILVYNDSNEIGSEQGTIEFWFKTTFDSDSDQNKTYFFDAISAVSKTIESQTASKISLPVPVSKVISIRYGDIDYSNYFYLSGQDIILTKPLPAHNSSVEISYIPTNYNFSRITIKKEPNNLFLFSVTSGDTEYFVKMDKQILSSDWNRMFCSYKIGSKSELVMIINGQSSSDIYQKNLTQEYSDGEIVSVPNIQKLDNFSLFTIFSDYSEFYLSKIKINNLRISSIKRTNNLDISGDEIDPNYSSAAYPCVEDEFTSYILKIKDKTISEAIINDDVSGSHGVSMTITDPFSVLKDERYEDLLVLLMNKIKSSHINLTTNFRTVVPQK